MVIGMLTQKSQDIFKLGLCIVQFGNPASDLPISRIKFRSFIFPRTHPRSIEQSVNHLSINLLQIITMNIYVGNLSREAGEMQLKSLFASFGEVRSVKIIKDKETGESRGFAFVEMPDDSEAQTAIREVDSKEFLSRRLKVNEATPKSSSARVYNSFSSNYGYKNRNNEY